MPTVDRYILVDVPVEEVFEFVADYHNAPRYQRQFSKFEPVGDTSYGLGATVDARGWFKGIPVRAKLRVVEFVPNCRIVSRSISGLKSNAEWQFSEESGGTRVRVIASFDLPLPVLSHALDRRVEAEVAAMTEESLRQLKRLLEGKPGSGRL